MPLANQNLANLSNSVLANYSSPVGMNVNNLRASNPVSGLIGGGLGLLQSWLNHKWQKQSQERTFMENRKMSDLAYNRELEMWNRQNLYNSPESQMKRFSEAGLNPNLIYGQGSPGNATVMPHYQAPQANYNYKPPIDVTMMLSNYQDFRMKQAQIDNLKVQNNVMRWNELLKQMQYNILEQTSPYKVEQEHMKTSLFTHNATMAQVKAEKQADIIDADINNTLIRTMFTDKQFQVKELERLMYKWNIGAKIFQGIGGTIARFGF